MESRDLAAKAADRTSLTMILDTCDEDEDDRQTVGRSCDERLAYDCIARNERSCSPVARGHAQLHDLRLLH